MAYCVKADLKNELRNFSKLVPDGLDEDTWSANMIRRADSYINCRLNRRYGSYIPFSPVPDMIWSLSVGLACFYILMANYAGQAVDKLEAIAAAYWKPNVEILNWLSKGNLELPEIDTAGSNLEIESSSEDYTTEFKLTKCDSEGTALVEGNMDDW